MVLIETTVLVALPPREVLIRSRDLFGSPAAFGKLQVLQDGGARLFGILPGDQPDLDMVLEAHAGSSDFTWKDRTRPAIALRVGFARLSGDDTWVTASLELPDEYSDALGEVTQRMRDLARDFQRVLEFGLVL